MPLRLMRQGTHDPHGKARAPLVYGFSQITCGPLYEAAWCDERGERNDACRTDVDRTDVSDESALRDHLLTMALPPAKLIC